MACTAKSTAEQAFIAAGLDVVGVPNAGAVTRDAWKLRAILKERFIEVVFLHTEREHLVASSAMRIAERGAVVRRIPAGCIPTVGRSTKLADRLGASRLLFTTPEDRARANAASSAYVAPLGVSVDAVAESRAAAREALGVDADTRLVMCVVDTRDDSKVTTAMRVVALLAERHRTLRMMIVGRAADADDTRMHASALGVTGLVRLLGERTDQATALSAADLGWVAADGDDGAYACLDFMAAGVPVIAPRSPLVSTYVPDGIAGVLLPPADPSDTASAVARFLADEATRIAMGNAGRTRARRDFPESAMVEGFAAAGEAAGDRTAWTAR